MAIEVVQRTSDIYELDYTGPVTLDDIRRSHIMTAEMAKKAGVNRYTHIIDTTQTMSVPVNAVKLAQIADDFPQVETVYIVNTSAMIRVLTNVISAMVSRPQLHIVSTIEEARQALGITPDTPCTRVSV